MPPTVKSTSPSTKQYLDVRVAERLNDIAWQGPPPGPAYAHYHDRMRHARYHHDPLMALDDLDIRDSEGRSTLEYLLTSYSEDDLARGLRRFMLISEGPSVPACLRAVRIKAAEHAQRERVLHEGPFMHDVYCLRCRRSVYTDYHVYVCGDEDTVTTDMLIGYAEQSDDPDQFLEPYFLGNM